MRIVGNDPTLSRQITATASGAISAAGKPLVVNTDGTVAEAGIDSATQSLGSVVNFEGDAVQYISATFDSNSNRVVIAYRDSGNSNYGTAIVGTISGTSVSYGTAVVFESAETTWINATFDSSNNKIVISYLDAGNSNYGTAIVGTVDSSDNSISFGSATVFNTASTNQGKITFDSSNNKVVIAYNDGGNSGHGYGIVGTVSGTSISFGSSARFENAVISDPAITFDTDTNQVIIAYRDEGNSNYGTAIVGTVSGTSISFGSPIVYHSVNASETAIAYDSNAQRIIVAYTNGGDGDHGYAAVGSVTTTEFNSFGTPVEFRNADLRYNSIVFDSNANKVVVVWREDDDSNKGKFVIGTVATSGNTVTFDASTLTTFESSNGVAWTSSAFDSSNNKVLIAWHLYPIGKSAVLQVAFSNENLTSENFIGTSAHSAADGAKVLVNTQGAIDENIPQIAQTAGYGSVVQFDAGNLSTGDSNALAFDSSNNKVVLIYRDNGNSNYGTALVGTIDTSDDSISWGSATVFESASIGGTSLTFDSSNNKVVGFFHDIGDSNKMKGIVGTVSGTSISFGSAADVSTAGTANAAATFDTNSNKVVVAFTDSNNSGYGTARVGTVSGTSISFGTAVVFTSAEANFEADSITFDSSNNRVVVAYTLSSGTNRGNAIVGTVSGTDISFGTQVAFNANFSSAQTATFDTSNNKVVIAFQDSSNSDQGTAVVGTVDSSDNSISFGSETIFNAAGTDTISSTFDSNSNTVLVSYRDTGDNNNGTIVVGTVSGTSISFGSENKYTTGGSVNTYNSRIIYDSNAKRAVVIYTEGGASGRGDSRVFRPAANLDLTAGQTYFVQTDGSLSETADSPSVTAGTALSATKLLVKG